MNNIDRNQKLCFLFASWYIKRSNSEFRPHSIRRATIQLWAEINEFDITLAEIEFIFKHWQSYIELTPDIQKKTNPLSTTVLSAIEHGPKKLVMNALIGIALKI